MPSSTRLTLEHVEQVFFDDSPPRLKVKFATPYGAPQVLELEQLSDGYRNLLAVVLDFARRLAQANPSWDNPLEAPGILLIDEIELHLHPGWQQSIIPNLRKVFPNTQLILATHSPQVLTTVRKEHVRCLTAQHTLEPLPADIGTYGSESAFALEMVFGVHTRPKATVETVGKLLVGEARAKVLKNAGGDQAYTDATDHEKRLKAAYPIHPEVFDRLYTDWSTLVKFQRTRGVLRLMAAVIHSLWEKGDRNPLMLPANMPIDDPRVQFELTRYLPDNWTPVIEKDVDSPNSLPLRLDGEVPNLGKFAACRRVARTIYLGSAPTVTAANRGVEDRRIKLGCVMPGESPAIFGDALRRLSAAATYLYQDTARYWYSTQPTVTKLAEDRAEQLKRDPDAVSKELDRRLRADLRKKGDFRRIHALPQSGQDVPDDLDARLVVLGSEYPYSREPHSAAETLPRWEREQDGHPLGIQRSPIVNILESQGFAK